MEQANLPELATCVEDFRMAVEVMKRRQADPEADPAALEDATVNVQATFAAVYTQLGASMPADDPEVVAIVQEWERSAQRVVELLEWLLMKEAERRDIVLRATTPQCPGLSASPLAWLCYLAWLLLCGLPVQTFRWVGRPPYTRFTHFLLLVAWTMCVVQAALLIAHTMGDIIGLLPFFQAALIPAIVLALNDDVAARRADIAMLKAMPAKAERMAAQLPGDLRRVVVEFGASAKAAAALAERAQNAVNVSMRRVDRFLWALTGPQVQPAHAPAGRSAAAPALARAAGSGGAN